LALAEEALLTMPILKVSNDIKKYALEVIRVTISPLGDCPQCQGNGYRDGICPDCSYVDPRVQEAIQEWQDAMGIQQVVKEQQQSLAEQNPNAKAAYRSLSFVDVISNDFNGMDFSTPAGNGKVKCPRCGQITFNNDSLKKGDLSGSCENSACGHEIAGALGFKRPKFLGIDPEVQKSLRRNFLSPASQKIEKNKNKLKKKSAKGMNPGALQDDSMNAAMDGTTRMWDLLKGTAEVDAQNKNEETSEEQS